MCMHDERDIRATSAPDLDIAAGLPDGADRCFDGSDFVHADTIRNGRSSDRGH